VLRESARPPVAVAGDEPLEKVRDVEARSRAAQRAPVHPEALDQLPPRDSATSAPPWTVKALTDRPVTSSFPTTIPILPHARAAFPHRPGATARSASTIPIAIVHPYSYRDRYKDATIPSTASSTRLPRSGVARSEGIEPPTF
jgi:hypothetical protein